MMCRWKPMNAALVVFLVATISGAVRAGAAGEMLSPSVTVSPGAINGVCLERGGTGL